MNESWFLVLVVVEFRSSGVAGVADVSFICSLLRVALKVSSVTPELLNS
jgi:hypothetical protein